MAGYSLRAAPRRCAAVACPTTAGPLERDARRHRLRNACVQYASSLGGVADKRPGTPTGAEDCLYLNIWAPRVPRDAVQAGVARLPVMVWIHGGGNSIGEGGFYNGGNLAATQQVVVVTLNYRLGPFGWLRHRGLRDAQRPSSIAPATSERSTSSRR